jgi:hypothetical protein
MLAVTWGLYCQVHRFARGAMLLADDGMGQEGVVLVRVMLEHTIGLHWIIARGDDGIDVMLASQSKQTKKWLEKTVGSALEVTAGYRRRDHSQFRRDRRDESRQYLRRHLRAGRL